MGVVHRVIAGIAPAVRVIDINHHVPRHDVLTGAKALWRAAPWLAPGVILGVVDPAVGTRRRAVAIQVTQAITTLVGPDNGLLLPAAHRLGPITSAVALAHHPGIGATFAGRDLFAPAAAQIAAGVDPSELGDPIDPETLAGDPIPEPRQKPDGTVEAEVLWIDRFGNAQLNLDWSRLQSPIPATLTIGTNAYAVRCVGAYAELEPGEVGLVVDSYGLLSISLNGRSAADHTHLHAGDAVLLSAED